MYREIHFRNCMYYIIGAFVKSTCILASFPGPHATFGCTNERKGPGMFPHVRDIEGGKVVERT